MGCLTAQWAHVNITAVLKSFYQGLFDLLYPHNCLLCRKHLSADHKGEALCGDCQKTIIPNFPPFCQKCSRHLTVVNAENLCPDCRHTERHFDRAWAAALYNEPMQELIHRFKYQNKTGLRKFFAGLMHSFIDTYNINIHSYDILVTVPLHPTRLRERGYNQTEFLAEGLSKESNLTITSKNLCRVRHTKNQALLGKKERWTNIHGAFKINDPSKVLKKSVLVVDDLFTTGATAGEAARLLKEAGAVKVDVLTLAIAY